MELPNSELFNYELGENGRSITVTGTSKLNQEVRMFMEWATPELMDENIFDSLTRIEQVILDFKPEHEEVAGSAAPSASSYVKRFNLPFGRKLSYSRYANHEYDEGALVLGPVKFVVSLSESGSIRWRTLHLKKRPADEKITLGIGGTRNAWFIALQ